MKTKIRRIAMISLHSSPMGELGTRDTGGMSVYVRELAQRLAQRGYGIDIFTRAQHPEETETIRPFDNVRIVHLDAGPREPLPQQTLHGFLQEFFDNLERFRGRERIDYDLVHSHYWLSGQIGRLCRKQWRIPHVFMFHTIGMLKNRAEGSETEPAPRLSAERRLAAECDLIIAGTEREKRDITELYGASPQHIAVVPCGVDLGRFTPSGRWGSRARLGFNGSERVILYVGRFDPIKGIDRLLAAVSGLERESPPVRIRVVLVGGGEEDTPEARALRAVGSRLGLGGSITFAGRKVHEELPDYYRAADVLVLPSHYESFGLVILEALACGTPVVATRVGAVEDVIRNGVNGWIVPENGPESLAEGIRKVLRMRHAGATSAEAIRATVESYDWSFIATAMEKEYRTLIGRGVEVPERAPMADCCSVCKGSFHDKRADNPPVQSHPAGPHHLPAGACKTR